jgi:hypothetical protein
MLEEAGAPADKPRSWGYAGHNELKGYFPCLADRRDACSPVRGMAEIAPVGDYFRRVKIQD